MTRRTTSGMKPPPPFMTESRKEPPLAERMKAARVLFKRRPTRLELAGVGTAWPCREISIRPHRNHSHEHVASAASAWAAYGNYRPSWSDAPYDDTLALRLAGSPPDLELVWYDVEPIRSSPDIDVVAWLSSRIHALRELSGSPILAVIVGLSRGEETALRGLLGGLPGVRLAPVTELLASVSKPFDPRFMKIAGSRLSEEANLALAKHLACRWIPAILLPRLKAVAVDLDHTLYPGVLAEDGPDAPLPSGHAALQASLLKLKRSGIMLALVSKNDPDDVEALFSRRGDFALRRADFSATEIGWGSKAESMLRVCQKMRIDPSSLLFIDDNPGELLEVAERLPGVSVMHAAQDTHATVEELEFYPGLWTWGASAEDSLRFADLEAESARAGIRLRARDEWAYLRELSPEMEVWLNPLRLLGRLHELSQKTNQFNLAISRLSEVQVDRYMRSPEGFVVAIALRDRLSDSGVVGAMFGTFDGDVAVVEEWTISCRALGRGLEDMMAACALTAAAPRATACRFHYRTGPRNAPALEWLAKLSGEKLMAEGCVRVSSGSLPAVAEMPLRMIIHKDERP